MSLYELKIQTNLVLLQSAKVKVKGKAVKTFSAQSSATACDGLSSGIPIRSLEMITGFFTVVTMEDSESVKSAGFERSNSYHSQKMEPQCLPSAADIFQYFPHPRIS